MTTDALGEGSGGTRWNAPGTSGPGDRSLAEERRPIPLPATWPKGVRDVEALSHATTVASILALDLLTLREHTERAGDRLLPDEHAARIEESLRISRVCIVQRNAALVAYAMLHPLETGIGFVRGFNTHPQHRDASVLRELFGRLATIVGRERIVELRSNVYRTNRLSMAFHRKLGFRITQENEKGVEFVASVQDLRVSGALRTDCRLRSIVAMSSTTGDR